MMIVRPWPTLQQRLRRCRPTWPPRDDQATMAVLKAQVGSLHAELIKAEPVAADHRANFAASVADAALR